MNSCEEIIEKYLLNENPLYTFSFPISLLCGIIMFGIMQAYNVSKNSYINQLLIPIATIFIVMVLIDVISKNMIPYNIKKTLYNNCQSWKNNQTMKYIEKFQSRTLPPLSPPNSQDKTQLDTALTRDLLTVSDNQNNKNNKENKDIKNNQNNKENNLFFIQRNIKESFQNSIEIPLDSKTIFSPSLIQNNDTKNINKNSKCIQSTNDCTFCSGGEPKPSNIVTAIPGPQWLPQTAESVQNNLKNGKYTQAKC